MVQHKRCLGCMEEKGDDPKCLNCGWLEGSQAASALHLPPGTILNGKYLLGRALGQGGFGITYLSWDLNLNLKLAIKEYFPQELASRATGRSQVSIHSGTMHSQYDYGMEKFLDEARMLARFEGHPNIVSVRDYFQANDTAYLVMNYIEGVTLKGLIAANGPKLPVDQALGIMMPVMDALKELHAADVLHRDISPDNIYINKKGQVILIDFGAARQAISEQGRALSVIIKPGYAPEEQYRSKGVQGPWTDIYSISATAYHMITGQLPPESLDRLVEDTLAPPSRLGVEINPVQEKALLKSLSVLSKDRFQNVVEFQDVLLGRSTMPAESRNEPVVEPHSPTPPPVAKIPDSKKPPSIQIPEDQQKPPLPPPPPSLSNQNDSAVPQVAVEKNRDVSNQQKNAEDSMQDDSSAQQLIKKGPNNKVLFGIVGGIVVVAAIVLLLVILPGSGPSDTFPCPQGGTYTGELRGDDRHGQGTFVCNDGSSYSGQWQNNLMHGQGRRVYANGAIYEGEFIDGLRHGWGTYTWPTGERYVGEFREGEITGSGSYSWPTGDTYVGEFTNNSLSGQGVLTLEDGRSFSGSWRNGQLNE